MPSSRRARVVGTRAAKLQPWRAAKAANCCGATRPGAGKATLAPRVSGSSSSMRAGSKLACVLCRLRSAGPRSQTRASQAKRRASAPCGTATSLGTPVEPLVKSA